MGRLSRPGPAPDCPPDLLPRVASWCRARETDAATRRHEGALRRWPGVSIQIDDGGGRWYFDEAEAARAVDFAPSYLRHLKGELGGQPVEYLPWAAELIVRPLFGWKRVADGLRRFRHVYCQIPKKNTKSLICSGIGLYLLECDGEPGADIIAAAGTREQATIVFGEARDMVEACTDEDLRGRTQVLRKAIVVPETHSVFRVVSADAKAQHGPNIHGLIFDEFHTQPNRELFDTLSKGIASRRQPVVLIITTPGDDQGSVCYEEYERAKRVLGNQAEEEHVLPVIFEATDKDDWTDPKVWARVNPGLGLSVKMEYLVNECNAAKREARKLNAFLQLNLGIWTQQATAWLALADWDALPATASPRDASGVVACFAVDVGNKIDLSAGVALLRRPREGPAKTLEMRSVDETGKEQKKTLNLNFTLDIFTRFWMPEARFLQRSKDENIPWKKWADEGWLAVTDGTIVDLDVIYGTMTGFRVGPDLRRGYLPGPGDLAPLLREGGAHLGAFAFDSWNATHFGSMLMADGIAAVEVPQTVKMLSEPSKVFEALLLAGLIRHDGNPVMRWCVGNVAAKEDKKGNLFPHKPAKNKQIDGVSATVTALGRLLVEPNAAPPLMPFVVGG